MHTNFREMNLSHRTMCEKFQPTKNLLKCLCNDQNGCQNNRVVKKHCRASAFFFNGFHSQTEEVYIIKRLKEGWIRRESAKIKLVIISNPLYVYGLLFFCSQSLIIQMRM